MAGQPDRAEKPCRNCRHAASGCAGCGNGLRRARAGHHGKRHLSAAGFRPGGGGPFLPALCPSARAARCVGGGVCAAERGRSAALAPASGASDAHGAQCGLVAGFIPNPERSGRGGKLAQTRARRALGRRFAAHFCARQRRQNPHLGRSGFARIESCRYVGFV